MGRRVSEGAKASGAVYGSAYAQNFTLAFFGIGFYRLWYQFNFYDLHFSADMGMVTVGANIARVAVLAAACIVAFGFGRFRRARDAFLWSGFVLMTLSSLLYLVDLYTGSDRLEALRIVVGGVGLVGGEMIWVFFLDRLKPGELFLYAGGGLALSCVLSLLLGYCAPVVSGTASLFVPALSVFSYWRAVSELDRRHYRAPMRDRLYESPALKRSVTQAVLSFLLYALLLGMALGYPDGNLREMSQGVRSLHQVVAIGLVAFVVWVVLIRGRSFQLQGYWLFQNVLMMASICLLMSGWAGALEASTFLLTNAMTLFYIPLVVFICLIGKHVGRPTPLVYAVVYGGCLLCMAVGRLAVYAAASLPVDGIVLLTAMVAITLVESTLVLRPRFMDAYPIGFELGHRCANEYRDVSDGSARALDAFAEEYGLNDTQRNIVSLMMRGRSRRHIADELHYSDNTIRNYVRAVYRKAGVHTKQELLDEIELVGRERGGLAGEESPPGCGSPSRSSG